MPKQSKQHTLWLLAAASAPLAHYTGSGWFPTLLAAAAILPLNLLRKSWEGLPRVLSLAELLWFGTVAGLMLRHSAAYWPSDNDLVVPVTLLALAALTPFRSAPRIGAVLAFCALLLAVPLAISGAAHMEPEWMKWTGTPFPAATCLVLLFPCLPPAGKGEKLRQSIWVGLLALLAALLVQGTISPQVARSTTDPFYQTARTLGYLEPVAAAAITLGWYAMTVYLLAAGSRLAETGGIEKKTAYVLTVGTAAAAVLVKVQPPIHFGVVLSILLWVLIPFLNKIKKSKKHEK